MLISGVAVLAIQITAAATRIGVAAASPDGDICVAMPTGALTPGMTVTLIQPDRRQSALLTTVVRLAPSCERLAQAMISGPYYLVQQPLPEIPSSDTLWVAFAGRLGTRELPSGVITVQLSPAYPQAQVRSCTSHEGLHLTVWARTPLKSDRVWHQYYYLGYDVEPSCTDRDVRDEPANLPLQPTSGAGFWPH